MTEIPDRPIKLVCVISRPQQVAATEFRHWWLEHHAGVARRLPGLLRYTISVAEESEDGTPPPWDGVAELWFADREAMQAAFDSEEGLLCAEEDRTAIGGRVAVITREHSIV